MLFLDNGLHGFHGFIIIANMEDLQMMSAAEPASALLAYDTDVTDEDYSFKGKDFGYPQTLEELEVELQQAEQERNDASKWCSSEECRHPALDGTGLLQYEGRVQRPRSAQEDLVCT
jgi:hypothetical protein